MVKTVSAKPSSKKVRSYTYATEVEDGYTPTTLDIWALGITIGIGGQYFYWNNGLSCGFGTFAIATALMATLYGCLILCTSEISSSLPFAGGAYGLARCTIGFYAGFIVGCCDSLKYIIYVALCVITIGTTVTGLFQGPKFLEPLLWILFYGTALKIHSQHWGKQNFWKFVMAIGMTTLIILLAYCFGCLAHVDFKNAKGNKDFVDNNFVHLLQVLPTAAWLYVGVEALSFTSDVVHEPKKSIPRGSLTCICTLFITSILVIFVTVSLPPGIDLLINREFPLDVGFGLMFNVSAVNNGYLRILSLPAIFSTAFGFMYGYAKILASMSKSKLLPEFIGAKSSHTAIDAMMCGSVVSIGIGLAIYFEPAYTSVFYDLCMLCGFIGYFSQCIGYISMHTKYKGLERQFRSPLGVVGAALLGIISMMGVISIVFFSSDNYAAVIVFACCWAGFSLYYVMVSRHHQTFSPDEQKIMFVAHVVNFNNRRGRRASVSGGGGASHSMPSPRLSLGAKIWPLFGSTTATRKNSDASGVKSQRIASARSDQTPRTVRSGNRVSNSNHQQMEATTSLRNQAKLKNEGDDDDSSSSSSGSGSACEKGESNHVLQDMDSLSLDGIGGSPFEVNSVFTFSQKILRTSVSPPDQINNLADLAAESVAEISRYNSLESGGRMTPQVSGANEVTAFHSISGKSSTSLCHHELLTPLDEQQTNGPDDRRVQTHSLTPSQEANELDIQIF